MAEQPLGVPPCMHSHELPHKARFITDRNAVRSKKDRNFIDFIDLPFKIPMLVAGLTRCEELTSPGTYAAHSLIRLDREHLRLDVY